LQIASSLRSSQKRIDRFIPNYTNVNFRISGFEAVPNWLGERLGRATWGARIVILRRVIEHVKAQNWTAVGIDFVIVVTGVFIGIQVANWNEGRSDRRQRELIVEALVADIEDHVAVQTRFVRQIDLDFSAWDAAFLAGQAPPPVVFRIDGSDTAPDTWGTLRQMPIASMFDPATVLTLSFYYSELQGLSEKYVRYIRFVEDDVLPNLKNGAKPFYSEDGHLEVRYAANMDRLREHREELVRLTAWAECLTAKLKTTGKVSADCSRGAFKLDTPRKAEAAP
jgi:hypothetical protein